MALEPISFVSRQFVWGFDPDGVGDVPVLYRAVRVDPAGPHQGTAVEKLRRVALLQAQRGGYSESDLVEVRAVADPAARCPGQPNPGAQVGFEFEFRKAV